MSEQDSLPQHQPVINWTFPLLSALGSRDAQKALQSGKWLTARELVQYELDLVNTGRITRQRWISWTSGAEVPSEDGPSIAVDTGGARGWLEQIVTDLPAAQRTMRAEFDAVVTGNLLLVPRLDSRGVTYRVIAPFNIAMAYAFVLLLDPHQTLGKDLCRCHYSACNKFFFVEKIPGYTRPRRLSCSPEHGALMDAEDAATRMVRLRKKKALAMPRKSK